MLYIIYDILYIIYIVDDDDDEDDNDDEDAEDDDEDDASVYPNLRRRRIRSLRGIARSARKYTQWAGGGALRQQRIYHRPHLHGQGEARRGVRVVRAPFVRIVRSSRCPPPHPLN